MAVGGSEDTIPFSKSCLDECIFKEKQRNVNISFQHCRASPRVASAAAAAWPAQGARGLMGDLFDFAGWVGLRGVSIASVSRL